LEAERFQFGGDAGNGSSGIRNIQRILGNTRQAEIRWN
jgi:hypothetical protein